MTSSTTLTAIHATTRPKLEDTHYDLQNLWWTTSGGSTFLPTGSEQSATDTIGSTHDLSSTLVLSQPSSIPSSDTSTSSTSQSSISSGSVLTVTTSFPITISQQSSTFVSFSESVFTSTLAGTALPATVVSELQINPICIGDGVDAQSLGLIATVVVPGVLGLILWLLFAMVRPRYRQIYGLREWFVQQDIRPKPLGRRFWAFLFPHVPMVPSIPSDVSDAGRSTVRDAQLFPSDEALSQRTLWICLLVVIGWSILGLVGFLPIYVVGTPCLAHSFRPSKFTGAYSVLQDLSLLRLLHLLDDGSVTANSNILSREIVNGIDLSPEARTRIIIITVLTIVLGVLPVLWKLIKEFNKLVGYRRHWVEVRCQGIEMGWLSARVAPGFIGWGERRLKDYIVRIGLSASLDAQDETRRNRRTRRNHEWSVEARGNLEIDIQSLFSIGNTTELAVLIDERDEILENLEIAETKYINSFKLSTPDPSIADFFPSIPLMQIPDDPPPVPQKPEISRPRPLGTPAVHSRRRRGRNPAHGSSSLPPTSFVMPSQYYKLRNVEGVSGGQFTDAEGSSPRRRDPSLTDSFNQRVIGSRFQEVNRDSVAFGRLPMGSQVMIEKNGRMGPVPPPTDSPLPDAAPYAPGAHSSWDTTAFNEGVPSHQWWSHQPGDSIQEVPEETELGADWVDVLHEDPEAFQNGEEYNPNATPPRRRRPRPPRAKNVVTQDDRRETFPLRNRGPPEMESQLAPHLRLQPRQPFVRPLSGLDHNDLGHIYEDISIWRAELKNVNAKIADVQGGCYNDIADGARIKGWLMVGRGLRFIPGMQLIEGRAKEDIRWDELQNEGGATMELAYWTIVTVVGILLGICLTAVAGLCLATAPEFGHYFPFFMPLVATNDLGGGVAICLASAVAVTLFISVAWAVIQYAGQLRNTVSLSGKQMNDFRTIFYVLFVVGTVWLFVVGAVLFAFGALSIGLDEAPTIANGAIYMSAFALVLIVNVAIIFPALLMLQPLRLWRVIRDERAAITPRQRFRAVYPRTYNPSYATACCVLAVLLASAFTLVFPLVAPAAAILLFLTLIAHRFLVGYVYGRTHSQTGGLLQIWLLKRLGTALALQPLLLGLIFLSRRIWIEGGILCGTALLVVLFVEGYCTWKTRLPGRKTLSESTEDALNIFMQTAHPQTRDVIDEESTSLVSSGRNTRARGSFASILDMMSLTLAVMPSSSQSRGPVPLETETLDDLTATERAARTHPDAPPHLPPLPFADHAEEMSGILYAPELLAPPPVIWLPNDIGGIGRSEAFDLQRYHELQVTLDVRSREDALPRRSLSPNTPRPRQAS